MSQFDKALLEMRQRILRGDFEAGGRLFEVELSEKLGISRTPLRQAFARLAEEGLLERVPTGGYRVACFSTNDVIDAIEIRGVLEGTAARLAAERGVDPVIADKCRETLVALDAVFGPGGVAFEPYVGLNARFHDLVTELSGSQVVKREVERVNRLPLASPSAFLQGQEFIPAFRESLQVAQQQHKSLFDAILNREGARAEALAREHARLARQNLDTIIKSKPEWVDQVPGLALISA